MTRVRRLIGGSAWSVGGQGINQLVGLAVLALLARHLDARDFGIVAVVVLVLDLTRDVMLAGLPDYLVRMQRWDDRLATGAFWFQVASGLLLVILGIVVGLALSAIGMPTIGSVAMALAPLYLIEALAAVPQARLRHELRFSAVVSATLAGAVAGGIAAVWVVLAGGGLWALVAGRLAGSLASSLVTLVASRWRPALTGFAGLGPALRFASQLAGGRVLGALNVKASDLIVGLLGGPALLGAYQLAAKPLNLVLQALLGQLQTVALSALSPLAGREAVGRSALSVLGAIALITFPVATGLAAVAPEFVLLAFGERWRELAAPTAILVLTCLPATVNYLLSPVLVKLDRPGAVLGFAASLTCVGVLLTALAAGWGLMAVACAFLLRTALGSILAVSMLSRHAGIAPHRLAAQLARPLAGSLAIWLAVVHARTWLPPMSTAIELACLVAVGAGIYALAIAPWAVRARGSVAVAAPAEG